MIYLYYLAAALLIYLSWKSWRSGVEYLNYFKQELATPSSEFAPFATVIAPCKGLDEGLEANLKAVVTQHYPGYEVIFVVDDLSDPAVPVINAVAKTAAVSTQLIVAAKATESGQKVENLREAVLHADQNSEVFVFVDSDVRPDKHLLRDLIAPLADEKLGASTGYRWFVTDRPTIATELRSAWNASIASSLGSNKRSNFCWGGAMAVRRDTFERLGIREKWRGTLSDDLAVTRILNEARMPIHFVPRAVVASTGTCAFTEMFEFTTRQIKIVRVYAQNLWLVSFLGAVVFNVVMVLSLILLFSAPLGTFDWLAALFTLLSVGILSTAKAWLRAKAVALVLAQHSDALRGQFPFQVTLWLFTPAIFLLNSLAALFSKEIRWRGTSYEMVSPAETRVL